MNYILADQITAPLYQAHHTAWVDARATVGEGTAIWMNTQIREFASIGKNCVIAKDVYVDKYVIIGDGCKVQNGSSIYHGVQIEDDVFVGPHVAFTNDRIPRAFNRDWLASATIVRHGASIGANATIRCGVEIGEYSMIGAGAVVTRDVEPYALVIGNPARFVCRVNKEGLRLDPDGNVLAEDLADQRRVEKRLPRK